MVEIHWSKYTGDRGSRYLLAFHLGQRSGRHYLLECNRVSDGDAALLRTIRPRLDALSLEERIAVVKHACPTSFRHAYRQIRDDRYTVVQKY